MREIWGCRHMVEVRHGELMNKIHSYTYVFSLCVCAGLHPNGIPCHKKKSIKFESITRDVCTL